MEQKQTIPPELFEGLTDEDEFERRARIGRYVVLQELGFFKEPTNLVLSRAEGEGTWVAQVRRRFSGRYGDVAGCHPADIEVAAEYTGYFDDIFDVEAIDEREAT